MDVSSHIMHKPAILMYLRMFDCDVRTYLNRANVVMVSITASIENDVPTKPMTLSEVSTSWFNLRGEALSKMAKCVRWLHSHTVTELLERPSFLRHPLSDHCPKLRMFSSSTLHT